MAIFANVSFQLDNRSWATEISEEKLPELLEWLYSAEGQKDFINAYIAQDYTALSPITCDAVKAKELDEKEKSESDTPNRYAKIVKLTFNCQSANTGKCTGGPCSSCVTFAPAAKKLQEFSR